MSMHLPAGNPISFADPLGLIPPPIVPPTIGQNSAQQNVNYIQNNPPIPTGASKVGIAAPEFSGLSSGVTPALQCISLQMLQRPSTRDAIKSVTYV
jgi:hypothetical protein